MDAVGSTKLPASRHKPTNHRTMFMTFTPFVALRISLAAISTLLSAAGTLQKIHDGRLAMFLGEAECCFSICSLGIRVGAFGQQELHQLRTAVFAVRRTHQRCISCKRRWRIRVRAMLDQ